MPPVTPRNKTNTKKHSEKNCGIRISNENCSCIEFWASNCYWNSRLREKERENQKVKKTAIIWCSILVWLCLICRRYRFDVVAFRVFLLLLLCFFFIYSPRRNAAFCTYEMRHWLNWLIWLLIPHGLAADAMCCWIWCTCSSGSGPVYGWFLSLICNAYV